MIRTITYDWSLIDEEPPGPGDFLASISRRTGEPTGTVYAILGAHRVRMKEERPFVRLRYYTLRQTLDDIPAGARVEGLVWHPRRAL